MSFSPSWLGTGNPGEDNVQYGVNIELLNKVGNDADDSIATLLFYNYSVDFKGKVVDYRAAPDGIHAQYQINIQNVGTEDASGLYLDWTSDLGQQVTGMSVTGPQGFESSNATRTALQDGISLGFDFVLKHGQEIVVTLDTFTPWALVSGDGYGVYTEMWADDGQIERGPFWYDFEDTANFYFIPALTK
jgi:hypothetical protein